MLLLMDGLNMDCVSALSVSVLLMLLLMLRHIYVI